MQLDEEVWEPDEFREPARLGREPAAGPHGRPAHAVHEAEAEASAATATTTSTAAAATTSSIVTIYRLS